jgi:hypothetical protein
MQSVCVREARRDREARRERASQRERGTQGERERHAERERERDRERGIQRGWEEREAEKGKWTAKSILGHNSNLSPVNKNVKLNPLLQLQHEDRLAPLTKER